MRFLTVAVTVLMLAACAFAADVDGKWSGTVSTPNGDIPQSFTFKADGATLNGAMAGLDGKDVPIKDGKIDGSNISFNVTLDFGGMPIVLSFKGAVEKEQIKLMGDFMGMPFELVVKKSS
jgi:opacity protein-like surface antigen